MKADITEIFSSIQGEGLYVGAKQLFVRFKRCNLRCRFCDVSSLLPVTDYSPEELAKTIEAADAIDGPHHSVSLTGGEPLLYADFLNEVFPLVKSLSLKMYLETNGTLPAELAKVIGSVDFVAMDFKLPSSTGCPERWDVHKEFLALSRGKRVFVKVIVTGTTTDEDLERAVEITKSVDPSIPLILQPVHAFETNVEPITTGRLLGFMEMASKGGLSSVRVIPQTHKMLGVR